MSASTNSLQKPEGFELYVRKFRAICVLHDVQIGSRRDLPGFLHKLVEDRPLAMDFWKLTGKLSNREGGELSDDQMLAVVIEGVTCGQSAEEGGEQKQSVDDLRAMLAGVDIQSPGQDRTEAVPPQQNEAVVPRVEVVQRTELTETTPREPPIDVATRRPLQEPPLREMEEPRLRPASTSRLVLEPAPLLSDDSLVLRKSGLSDRTPLESYSQPEGFGKAISVIAIVLALAGVAFAGFHYRAPLREEIITLSHNVQEKIQQRKTAATPVQQSAPPEIPSQIAAPAEQSSSSPSATTVPQANTNTTKSQEPPPAVQSQPVATGAVNADSNRKASPDYESASASSIDLAGAVKVDPAVMEENLIVSRVPVYPDAAKASRVEGEVIIQALISKEGTVKRVHVIQGDSRLRGAAMESIYARRYRPYLLDGQPVEVTTTITVNFTLDQ